MEQAVDTQSQNPILSMVSEGLAEWISKIPPEILCLRESEICAKAYADEESNFPPDVDFHLRNSFWEEYRKAILTNGSIKSSAVYDGICAKNSFLEIQKNPLRLAYIITPPQKERKKQQYLLSMAWSEMVKILKAPIKVNAKTGLPDAKLQDLKAKIFMYLHASEHGAPIQKIKQENTNLNMEIPVPPSLTPAEIDAKLAILEMQALGPAQPEKVIALPIERVVQEAGRVTEEFKR